MPQQRINFHRPFPSSFFSSLFLLRFFALFNCILLYYYSSPVTASTTTTTIPTTTPPPGRTAQQQQQPAESTDVVVENGVTLPPTQTGTNVPYDPQAPLADQVRTSLQVSLRNLQTDYLDAWIMHSPESTMERTMEVYRVMEQAVDDKVVLRLGISNCYDIQQLRTIYELARIKPVILQNRFYGENQWDQDLRAFCETHEMWYQSFWTLTANRKATHTREALEWANKKGLPSSETLLYAYLMSLGYGTPLDGTTSVEHMKEDLAVMERVQKELTEETSTTDKIFETEEDLRAFEKILGF